MVVVWASVCDKEEDRNILKRDIKAQLISEYQNVTLKIDGEMTGEVKVS